ncbi:hypothetical protein, partial [Nonomuraea harbinensis]|uniref:hypothetical protein n=1 Tax=Nonomuraea harbinensis TaxID=1286938 RepID=UPI001C5E4550
SPRRAIDDHLPLPPAPLGVRLTPCAPAHSSGGGRRLKVGPAGDAGPVAYLKVGPPAGFTGSLNDWLCATQPPARAAVTSIAA